MNDTATDLPVDTELEAFVGPVAYREWQNAKPIYHEQLAAWARALPTLSDNDFTAEAASAIHGSALTSSFRGNWNHEHFKASAVHVEARRRHVAAGHDKDCRGANLYTQAYYSVTRSQGYHWDETPACDGTCKDA
jgi:hypothetical protein